MNQKEFAKQIKRQFKEEILKFTPDDKPTKQSYSKKDIECAFASGMLMVISACVAKDGAESLPTQLRIMHKALRQVGEEMGLGVTK